MAKNIYEIMKEVSDLNYTIKKIMRHADFDNYEDLSGLEYNKTDAQELFLKDELCQLLSKLSDVSWTLDYLNRPVKVEGVLHKNSNGRYEVNGMELTSGHGLEYLATDDRHCRYDEHDEYVVTPYWCASRIEHDGTDYYIVGADNLDSLENVRVRLR